MSAAAGTVLRASRVRILVVVAALLACGVAAALAYVQGNLVDIGGPDIGLFQLSGNLVLRLEQDASFRILSCLLLWMWSLASICRI